MRDYLDKIYNFCISSRKIILTFFKFISFGVIIFLITALIFSRQNDELLYFFYSIGSFFGTVSLLLFVLTLFPGIGGRLGVNNRFLSIVKIYRMQIGILMYLFALLHVTLSKVITITSFVELANPPIFEVMGIASLFILFFLFVTSNTVSLIRLKLHWYRIHRAAYIGMVFIFLHVALQGLSVWTIIMGVVLILQVVSFVVIYRKTGSFTGGKPL